MTQDKLIAAAKKEFRRDIDTAVNELMWRMDQISVGVTTLEAINVKEE